MKRAWRIWNQTHQHASSSDAHEEPGEPGQPLLLQVRDLPSGEEQQHVSHDAAQRQRQQGEPQGASEAHGTHHNTPGKSSRMNEGDARTEGEEEETGARVCVGERVSEWVRRRGFGEGCSPLVIQEED